MAFTYSKLASTTVGAGGTSTITFSNIPQNYTDLVLKVSARSSVSGTNEDVYLTVNGSTTNGTLRYLAGNGASPFNGTNTRVGARDINGNTSTANTFSNTEFYIPNYSNGSVNKSFSADSVTENNATTAVAGLTASLWSNVTAINSLSLTASTGTLQQYSTATLYGIRVEL